MLLKVCCIQDEAELLMAADAGATHVGLVGPMPSGPGCLEDARIAELVEVAPPSVRPVLLTSEVDAGSIVAHLARTGARTVQVVTTVPAKVRQEVRQRRPEVEIIQVVHVEGVESRSVADEAAEGADMLLLDSGRPSAAVPELGGTGRVHDWGVSAEIVGHAPIPVLLAGGLNPENASAAMTSVRPAGLDVCSGLRDETKKLEASKLTAFVAAVRSGALA